MVPKWAWADFAAGLASAEMGPISFIVGGATSMAMAMPSRPDNVTRPSVIKNPMNQFDQVGALHNQVVEDYSKEHNTFELSKYYAFLETHKQRYGVRICHQWRFLRRRYADTVTDRLTLMFS
jgi:hypothetical protein